MNVVVRLGYELAFYDSAVRRVNHYTTRTPPGKKLRFILLERFDFHMPDNLSIVGHAFVSRVLITFSVDETLLPRKVNLSTSFRKPPFSEEMSLV